jgi:hypothetical protein
VSPSGPAPTGAAQAIAEPAGDPGTATQDDLALGDDPGGGGDDNNDPAPAPRPRITETGPMLPEDLGSRPQMNLDMTHESAQGPMGLEPGQISSGLSPLMSRFQNCAAATSDGAGHGPHGHVSVRMRIRGDGHPTAARVSGGSGPAEFTTCVRRVVAAARFDHFQGPDIFATWGFDVD